MKATELRIGNFYDHNNEIKSVTPAVISEVWESERSWCKPIPLTEDWLIRFGFVDYSPDKNRLAYRLRSNDGRELAMWINEGFIRYQTSGSGFTTQMHHVKTVHSLQNLYFALIGEELTIK